LLRATYEFESLLPVRNFSSFSSLSNLQRPLAIGTRSELPYFWSCIFRLLRSVILSPTHEFALIILLNCSPFRSFYVILAFLCFLTCVLMRWGGLPSSRARPFFSFNTSFRPLLTQNPDPCLPPPIYLCLGSSSLFFWLLSFYFC